MGNHDGAVNPTSKVSVFAEYYPYPYARPGCWAFDFGSVRVVVVGDMRLKSGKYEDVAWVVEEVGQGQARPWTILLIHDPEEIAYASRDSFPERWQFSEDSLLEALRARGLDLIVSGHWHSDNFSMWDGVPFENSQSIAGSSASAVPRLVMATPFGDPSSAEDSFRAHYYRFTAAGSAMTIDVFDVEGQLWQSYSVTSHP